METTDTEPTLAPQEAICLGKTCAVCEEALVGAYCHACGERRPHAHDESLWHFLREQFHEVTSADGRMWRTLRALFIPGKLTDEYFAGRRGLYLRPVRVFLVANVVFFLVLTLSGGTSNFLGGAETNMDARFYGDWAASQIEEAATEVGVERDVFTGAFDARAGSLATSLIVVLVPLLALLLTLVLGLTGASTVRHLVFATHYLTFAMAVTVALAAVWVPVVLLALRLGAIPQGYWATYSLDPIIQVTLVAYLVFAIRRVYRLGWTGTVAAALAVMVGVTAVLVAYQFILFNVTLWTVNVPA